MAAVLLGDPAGVSGGRARGLLFTEVELKLRGATTRETDLGHFSDRFPILILKSDALLRRALYHCNYCARDISCTARVKCAICADFDLCLECFSVGVEIPPHSNGHDYRIVDNLSFPIFHSEWGADEEMLLLEAVDIYGLGNWAGVGEHVGGKSAEQCKKHYFQVYIDVSTFPFPTPAPELASLSHMELLAGSVVPAAVTACPLIKRYRLEPTSKPQTSGQLNDAASPQQEEEANPSTAAASAPAATTTFQPATTSSQPGTPGEAEAMETDAAPSGAVRLQVHEPMRVKNEEMTDGTTAKEDAAEAGKVGESKARGTDTEMEGTEANVAKAEESNTKGAAAEEAKTDGNSAAHGSKAVGHHHAHKEHVLVSPAAGDQKAAHVQIGARSVHHDPTDASDAGTGPSPSAAPEAAGSVAGPENSTAPTAAATTTASKVSKSAAAATSAAAAAAASAAATSAVGTIQSPKEPPPAPALPTAVGIDPQTGYHARRFEFDPEYDNDAEVTIADIEFNDDDTEEDRQRKLRVLEIYNKRLDEREHRRDWLVSSGLINLRKAQALEKKRTPGERGTVTRLRAFATFEQAPGAHDELVEGILLEQRLRELSEYRRNGLRTFADADVFESDRRKERKEAGTPFLPTPSSLLGAAPDLLLMPAFAGAAGFKGEELTTPVPDWDLGSAREVATGYRSSGRPRRSTPPAQPFGVDFANALADSMGANSGSLAAATSVQRQLGPAGAAPLGGNRQAAASLQSWRNRRGIPLDISCLPGLGSLTQRERELCTSIRMLPSHYLALKDMMMRDSAKHGSISRAEARNFFRLDTVRSLRIYDLWVSCGWVKTPNAPNSAPAPQDDREAVQNGVQGTTPTAVDLGQDNARGLQGGSDDVGQTPIPTISKPKERIVLNL
eukprot:gene13693-19585_t